MNLTVYIPRDLEERLRARAERARLTPSLYVQSVVREALVAPPARFSPAFEALAGSWEDERPSDEILDDIGQRRLAADRPEMQ